MIPKFRAQGIVSHRESVDAISRVFPVSEIADEDETHFGSVKELLDLMNERDSAFIPVSINGGKEITHQGKSWGKSLEVSDTDWYEKWLANNSSNWIE